MQAFNTVGGGAIEVLPLVLVEREFPARPSSLPDIRGFVRERLSRARFSADDLQALSERVLDLLLEVAGPGGAIQVSLRIFPDHAEIDVLPASPAEEAGIAGPARTAPVPVSDGTPSAGAPGTPRADLPPGVTFADWLAGSLRREGMTMEAAARQLQVSVKTVSRWVGGTTEPRLRDLSRIRVLFGELPFP
jgi:hypothetical protein